MNEGLRPWLSVPSRCGGSARFPSILGRPAEADNRCPCSIQDGAMLARPPKPRFRKRSAFSWESLVFPGEPLGFCPAADYGNIDRLAGADKLLFRFENFLLDCGRRELRRDSDLIPIEPKVFDLLAHLVHNRERVVSRDDLIASVWDGRIVSESALATCINAARASVGDNGEEQRLIKTFPRKGLRFVGAVREEQEQQLAPAIGSHQKALALPDRPSI